MPSSPSASLNDPTLRLTGGRALAEMLKLHEIGPMFGMGGFQLLPFYDAVRDLGLMHTLINDERCGIFAADAWARVTGRPGVCDATLGPARSGRGKLSGGTASIRNAPRATFEKTGAAISPPKYLPLLGSSTITTISRRCCETGAIPANKAVW